jgi:hypothetical protein
MRKTWIIVAAGVLVAGLLCLSWEGRVSADMPMVQNATGMNPLLAGLYYSQNFPGAEGPAQVLWNITADGQIFESTAVDQGGPTGLTFANGHGTWVKIGPRTIASTNLLMGYDPAQGGLHVWNLKINAIFEFSRDCQTFTIYQTNSVYSADQDPFDPDEVPAILPPTEIPPYTGKRVNVELPE